MHFTFEDIIEQNFNKIKAIKNIKTHELEEKMHLIEEIIDHLEKIHKDNNELHFFERELNFLKMLYNLSKKETDSVDDVFFKILKKVSIYAYGLDDKKRYKLYYESLYAYFSGDLNYLNHLLQKARRLNKKYVFQELDLKMVLLKNIDVTRYVDYEEINDLKEHLSKLEE